MTKEEIVDWLEMVTDDEDVILFDEPDYADAFIGISEDGRAVYDYDLMVKSLVDDGMTEEEAVEFIDYNIIGFKTDRGPTIVYRMER